MLSRSSARPVVRRVRGDPCAVETCSSRPLRGSHRFLLAVVPSKKSCCLEEPRRPRARTTRRPAAGGRSQVYGPAVRAYVDQVARVVLPGRRDDDGLAPSAGPARRNCLRSSAGPPSRLTASRARLRYRPRGFTVCLEDVALKLAPDIGQTAADAGGVPEHRERAEIPERCRVDPGLDVIERQRRIHGNTARRLHKRDLCEVDAGRRRDIGPRLHFLRIGGCRARNRGRQARTKPWAAWRPCRRHVHAAGPRRRRVGDGFFKTSSRRTCTCNRVPCTCPASGASAA